MGRITTTRRIPHRCPVCKGKDEDCRACENGIVYETVEETNEPIYYYPARPVPDLPVNPPWTIPEGPWVQPQPWWDSSPGTHIPRIEQEWRVVCGTAL